MDQIILLLSFIIIFYLVKPSITFKPNGQLREFGVGYSKDGYRKTFLTFITLIFLFIIILKK
jgi:hypothetical protein